MEGMEAYIIENPSEAVDVPESLRTMVWENDKKDWYLSAYMLGLTQEQITAPIVDGATITAFAKENVVLFSTNYLMSEKLLNDEQMKELPEFLEKLGQPS
jgi:hypothetical protein